MCRYYLVVWRRPKFFLFNYIQPAVLINIIALFVFLIPAESGEKVTLRTLKIFSANSEIFSGYAWHLHYAEHDGVPDDGDQRHPAHRQHAHPQVSCDWWAAVT